MAQAIQIQRPGGAEVLKLETITLPEPQSGEVLIRQTAIGVNFIDVYHRTGFYKLPLPAGIGLEGAGVVEKTGPGATLTAGDRVAYCGGPVGSYATHRVMAEKHLVKLPDNVSDETAAALMLKGMTAHYLLRRTFRVQKGDWILFHAAAGGVGLIACQWAKHLGATVIGTVSSEEKAALAKAHGCDYPIVYTKENFVSRVKELTEGRGVDAVYDSVGKTTFMDSLDCLKTFGMMVSFGQASGPAPAIEPTLLAQKGSLYLTRPSLMHYIMDVEVYRTGAKELFDLAMQGAFDVRIGARYKLADAAKAHADLESRKTTGALILLP
jgi:NADPH2:quinone reductase